MTKSLTYDIVFIFREKRVRGTPHSKQYTCPQRSEDCIYIYIDYHTMAIRADEYDSLRTPVCPPVQF